jgi:CheY-like chemotaxis protein
MDGSETCEEIERLRQRGELEETRPPILMISAYSQDEIDLPDGLTIDYMAKPITASSLYDALVRAEGGTVTTRPPTSGEVPNLNGRHLLLVEDNEVNQEVATLLLERTGARVVTAENGGEALEQVRSEAPDLILMDLQMPVMDGFEATRTLRDEGFNGPIIALSAAVMDDDREHARAAGVDGHLGKPIESEDLYTALSNHLAPIATHRAEPPSARELRGESGAVAGLPEELPGFDIPRGRQLLGGDDALYARLLRSFRGKLASDYAPLLDHLRAGRDEEARRIAHTLKGAAGTLGATTIQWLAEEIDSTLKAGHPVTEHDTSRLEQAFQEADRALETLSPSGTAGSAGTRAAVETLRQRLTNSELVEEETLREATGYLRGRGLECDELESKVEQMDFDEALQHLDELVDTDGDT